MKSFSEKLQLTVDVDSRKGAQGLDQFSKKTQRVGHDLDRVGGTMTRVGVGMTALGVVAAAGLFQASQAASDLNEAASKSATVFGEASGKIAEFAESATDIGLSERAAHDAVGTFGNLLTQLGYTSDQAADMSISMTELAADFASFHNLDITEVIEAQTAAFRGEYDSLQRMVPTISAAAVQQQAMASTGKANAEALTEQDKALAVYELMLSGAGTALGDFERTSDSAANQQRVLQAEFENLKAEVGQAVLPVLGEATGALSAMAGGFMDLNEATGGTLAKIATYGTLALLAGGATSSLIGWVIQARANFKAAWDAVSGLSSRLSAFKGAALGGTVGLAALAAGFVLWQQEQAKGKQQLEEVRQALQDAEGDITRLDAAFVTSRFEPWIEDLNDAGVSLDTLRSALSGNEEAIRAVEAASAGMGHAAGSQLRARLQEGIDALERENAVLAENEEFAGEAGGAAKVLGERTTDAAGAAKEAEEGFDDATSAISEYADQIQATFDPLFGMVDALQTTQEAQATLRQRQDELAVAVRDYGEGSAEAMEAQQALTDAQTAARDSVIGLQSAALTLQDAIENDGLSAIAARDQFIAMATQMGFTADEAAVMADQFGFAASESDRLGRTDPTVTVSSNVAHVGGQLEALRRRWDGAELNAQINVRVNQRGGLNIGGGVNLFHEGGMVPGPRGREIAGVLLGQEEVLHWDDPRHSANIQSFTAPRAWGGGSGPGGSVVNVNVDLRGAILSSSEDAVRWISTGVNRGLADNRINLRGARLK